MVPFNFYPFIIIGLIFLFLVQCSNINNPNYVLHQNDVAFETWLKHYKKNAKQELNVSNEVIEKIFQNVHYNQKVLHSDSKQAEFTLTADTYLNRILTEVTINTGTQFLKTHWNNLKEVSDLYKVPPHVIVAFLGVETRYGRIKPQYKATEAIANLAFNPRRRTFFTKELNSLVVLINKGYVDIDVKSSWAGALGYPQFMPSTYLNYGVDGTGNSKVDLIGNYKDTFASVANFLRALGWNYYRKWGYEVILPKNFNKELINVKVKYPLYQWENLGVKCSNGKKFTDISALSRIITLDNNKSYLVTSNFDVIMKWNKSVLFAVAIGLLSDELTKNSPQVISKTENLKVKNTTTPAVAPLSKTNKVKSSSTTKKVTKTNKKSKQNLNKNTEKTVNNKNASNSSKKNNAVKNHNNHNKENNSYKKIPTLETVFNEKIRIFSGEDIN